MLVARSLSCSAVGGTSCLLLVPWHPCRLMMSGLAPPPNQVPLRPHYSHFYLLHAAAVHHLMMLDSALDGAAQAELSSLSGFTSNPSALWKLSSIYFSIPLLFMTLYCQLRSPVLTYYRVASRSDCWLIFLFVLSFLRCHSITVSFQVCVQRRLISIGGH